MEKMFTIFFMTRSGEGLISRFFFLWENEHCSPVFYYRLMLLISFHITYIIFTKKRIHFEINCVKGCYCLQRLKRRYISFWKTLTLYARDALLQFVKITSDYFWSAHLQVRTSFGRPTQIGLWMFCVIELYASLFFQELNCSCIKHKWLGKDMLQFLLCNQYCFCYKCFPALC